MIIDALDNFRNYIKLNKHFESAFKFLRQKNLKKYCTGHYDIKNNDVYALILKASGKEKKNVLLEAHRKYIDIQMCIAGEDLIGYKLLAECKRNKKAYDPKKDYSLMNDEINSWFKLKGNAFAIFFPEDAHAPLAGKDALKKVVIKVRVE